ncbi:MAG: TolC family protein [Rubrivivax sp.]|nr:TolC family protein [Rubrivivax sp.]
MKRGFLAFMQLLAVGPILLAGSAVAQAQAQTAGMSWAAITAPVDLPSDTVAARLIDADPTVTRARRELAAARERASMLETGPHEWTAKAMAQRRSYRSGDASTQDWQAGVERSVRIGGKAGIDRRIGEALVREGEARVGEARHESARTLLQGWMDWLAAEHTQRLWQDQLGVAESNLKAASSRRKAGDASMLEQNAARADLAEVQRQAANAATDLAKARARLAARFPGVELAPPATLSEPLPLDRDAAAWRERIVSESDSLRMAEHAMQRAVATADRAKADRTADPTIGVHAGYEASRAERVVGISLSIPLGGTYRAAQSREALQQADAARDALEAERRELEMEIAGALAEAGGGIERWKAAEAALAASSENARLSQRAYALGEGDIQGVLLARRQSLDAALGALQARIDALRARYRLWVDAHLIWKLAED